MQTQCEHPSKSEPRPLTLTVEEAAKWLGISRIGAYKAVERGDINHIRIGRRILIPSGPFFAALGVEDEPDRDDLFVFGCPPGEDD